LFNEDFLTAQVPEVDLIVTDPPYRWNKTTGGRANNDIFASKWQGQISGKNIVKASLLHNNISFKEWVPKVFQSLKSPGHCYIFLNDKNIQEALNIATKNGFRLHNILVWHKNNCTPNKWYMKNAEFILFLYKGKAFPINNLNTKQLMFHKNISGKKKLHPTQKPISLLEALINNSSNPGEVVLDPFMGSGSTGVAACNTGRNFVGYEIDENYFKIAESRFKNII